ncbi:hypothetical protein [Hasllibacter halocynthiae]|uniref:hypothetical protein n=1 Tax=Hasllibacter halocynthiae TaxID=595589 RepID=UPI0011B250ED|nr:hypothetical protein [Hasllibacter halocynthiae]
MAKLVRAAQDVLTLLAQDGIYIDDIPAEPAPPEPWRAFAAGPRGRAQGWRRTTTDRRWMWRRPGCSRT